MTPRQAMARRSRWREFALMHMLVRQACNAPLSLQRCLQQWAAIAQKLREPPRRKRSYQCDGELEMWV